MGKRTATEPVYLMDRVTEAGMEVTAVAFEVAMNAQIM